MPTANKWENAKDVVEVYGKTQKWNMDTDEGRVVEGVYIAVKDRVGMNKSKVYVIKLDNGETRQLWDNALLNDAFSKIPLNAEVRIEYLGKEDVADKVDEETGLPYTIHKFRVQALI